MGEAGRVGRPARCDWPRAKPGPDLLLPAIACSSAIPIATRQCGPESLAERFPARPADGQGRIWSPAGPRQWREDAATASAMPRSEEHTSELQSLMRISYAVFCLKKKKHN